MSKKIKKVLILIGGSQYNVLFSFARELREALVEQGIKVDYYHTEKHVVEEVKANLIKYDLFISFNGMGVEDGFLEKRCNSKMWCFLVDHPFYHEDRLKALWGTNIVSCIDREHVAYLNGNYNNLDYKIFLPHGGSKPNEVIKYEFRKYDIVFIGSYRNPDIFLDVLEEYSNEMKGIFYEIIQQVMEKDITIEKALSISLKKRNINLSSIELRNIMKNICFIDEFIRYTRRKTMIEYALKSKRKIDIFGNGWDSYECKNEVNLHKEITYNEAIQVMANSKIVLNNMPLFFNGSHERIFTSMQCGAVCITNNNQYLNRIFQDNINIVYFDWKNIEQLPIKINDILNNVNKADSIAQSGRKISLENHNWKNRAKEMIDILENIADEEKIDKVEDTISIYNDIDMDFNELVKWINQSNYKQIFYKIQSRYYFMKDMGDIYIYQWEERIRSKYSANLIFNNILQYRAYQLKYHIKDIIYLYKNLQDFASKKVLYCILMNRITMKQQYLEEIKDSRYNPFLDKDIIKCSKNEVFVDIGAYNGNYALNFIGNYRNYKKIYCYEGNIEYFSMMKNVLSGFPNIVFKNIRDNFCDIKQKKGIENIVNLDGDIKERITFLKIDAEEKIKEIIKKAKEHICKDHPKLTIALYTEKDIWEIAYRIGEINKSYKFYLRYYENKIVLYCI